MTGQFRFGAEALDCAEDRARRKVALAGAGINQNIERIADADKPLDPGLQKGALGLGARLPCAATGIGRFAKVKRLGNPGQREAQRLGASDELQPRERLAAVVARPAAGPARRLSDQPCAFLQPDRLGADPHCPHGLRCGWHGPPPRDPILTPCHDTARRTLHNFVRSPWRLQV